MVKIKEFRGLLPKKELADKITAPPYDVLSLKEAKEIYKKLKSKFRVYLDDREHKTPGWKYYYWDLRGIPLRIDIGPKDLEKNSVTLIKRNDKKKISVSLENLEKEVEKALETINKELYEKARKEIGEKIVEVTEWDRLKEVIESGKVAKVPFCMKESCANIIKEELNAEVRGTNITPEEANEHKCIVCGEKAKYWVYVGKTY